MASHHGVTLIALFIFRSPCSHSSIAKKVFNALFFVFCLYVSPSSHKPLLTWTLIGSFFTPMSTVCFLVRLPSTGNIDLPWVGAQMTDLLAMFDQLAISVEMTWFARILWRHTTPSYLLSPASTNSLDMAYSARFCVFFMSLWSPRLVIMLSESYLIKIWVYIHANVVYWVRSSVWCYSVSPMSMIRLCTSMPSVIVVLYVCCFWRQ